MEIFLLHLLLFPRGDFWQRTNRRSILSLKRLSVFRERAVKSVGGGGEWGRIHVAASFLFLVKLDVFGGGGPTKKRHLIEHAGGHEGSRKKTKQKYSKEKKVIEWSST